MTAGRIPRQSHPWRIHHEQRMPAFAGAEMQESPIHTLQAFGHVLTQDIGQIINASRVNMHL
jgi:hypothetical protein